MLPLVEPLLSKEAMVRYGMGEEESWRMLGHECSCPILVCGTSANPPKQLIKLWRIAHSFKFSHDAQPIRTVSYFRKAKFGCKQCESRCRLFRGINSIGQLLAGF